MFPLKISGSILIFRNGGKGRPKNLVVELVNGGINSVPMSKDTKTSSLESLSVAFEADPVPFPPSALYSKSGYLAIPSLQSLKDLNLTL